MTDRPRHNDIDEARLAGRIIALETEVRLLRAACSETGKLLLGILERLEPMCTPAMQYTLRQSIASTRKLLAVVLETGARK